MATLGKRSVQSLTGVHPNLGKLMTEAIKDTPVDFTITDGGRTAQQQAALYAQGRTKAGGIVTKLDGYNKKSNHQAKADGYYHAVDLYPYVDGKVDYNDEGNNLPIIAAHIKATAKCLGIKIGWGGDWKGSWDKPHFELV